MSAYDKDFSDAVYGIEDDKRYVTEMRLRKMLQHEINLIEQRIKRENHPNKLFFSYANTVTTIDFAKKFNKNVLINFRNLKPIFLWKIQTCILSRFLQHGSKENKICIYIGSKTTSLLLFRHFSIHVIFNNAQKLENAKSPRRYSWRKI